jgi:protein-S-isoprenylcysteine O-methyltransferase Ste14
MPGSVRRRGLGRSLALSINIDRTAAKPPLPVNWPVAMDWFERTLLVVLSVVLIHRVVAHGGVVLVNVLQVLNELMVVAAVLLRRVSGAFSMRPVDWLFGVAGTALPLLAAAGGEALVPVSVSAILMFTGFLVQFSAKAVMWRSFGVIAANRGVKREGPYRWIRHPMYSGYIFMYVGFVLTNPTWRNVLIYSVCLVCMAQRIWAEERILKQDPAYRDYMAATRSRLFPFIY